MGITKKFFNKKVFIDTAPLIYFIEGHTKFQNELIEIFKAGDEEMLSIQTSILTLLEVLVQPIRLKRFELANQYEKILTKSKHIELIDTDIKVVKNAASIRAQFNFKTPDSIQLATAVENSADIFLTNDSKLQKFNHIEVITLEKINYSL